MKRLICAFCVMVAFLFVGCDKIGGGDVGLVKNGYLSFDKSITVGQAFDGYKYFGKKEWTAEKTVQGRRLVTFKAQVNQDYINEFNKNASSAYDTLVSATILFQFTINNDSTFEPSDYHYVLTFATGRHLEPIVVVVDGFAVALISIYHNNFNDFNI